MIRMRNTGYAFIRARKAGQFLRASEANGNAAANMLGERIIAECDAILASQPEMVPEARESLERLTELGRVLSGRDTISLAQLRARVYGTDSTPDAPDGARK